MAKIRLLIVDDHEVVRRGLSILFGEDSQFEVVGEAFDGIEAVNKAEQLNPDVAIIDLQLPCLSGVEATRQIALRSPGTRVIAYTFYDDEATVLSALHAGAMGYVLKGSDMNELLLAIKNIREGHHYLGPPLPELAIDAFINMRKAGRQDPYYRLTNREKEVLQLVAERNSNEQIANKLFISRRTVEIHRSHIMKKLGLHRPQVDLVRYAAERGLIKPLHNVSDEPRDNGSRPNEASSLVVQLQV